MTAPKAVHQLVEKFDSGSAAYKRRDYNETQLRVEFVNPLFEALGWNVRDRSQVSHEARVLVEGKPKHPDYGFRIGKTTHFYLETKKPALNLRDDPSPAYQLRRYGWSGNLPVSILSDFEEFIIYDCRIQPHKNDPASKGRLRYYRYPDYIEKWDEFETLFSRDAVRDGSLRNWIEDEKTRGALPVDEAFLREMESWRETLAKDMALHNRDLNRRQLNLLVQRTIDRIVFFRIAEDRGIELYGRLQRAASHGKQVYDELKILFKEADDKYNSGLFHFEPGDGGRGEADQKSLHIRLSDAPLRQIIDSLYYPASPYEFSVLPADILGQVYERFLGKVIELEAGGRARVEDKPEVRKAGGVYYTPTYIVDYIVENTVGKLLQGKTPAQAAKLRFLDPACGSGSFLTGAYQHLLDWHLDYYRRHPNQFRNRRRETAQGLVLTTAEKRRILLNNIYGVDLDQNAVEVSKLALLLKMLENETDAAGRQTLMFSAGGRILPDLSGNIKWGNSLIGSDFYGGRQMGMFDEEAMYRVKAFDWASAARGFGEIMKQGGFDAVIGNPPYVRQEILGKAFKDYAKQKYEAYVGTADLYIYFIEQSHKLMNSNGLYGVICSNKFLRSNYGKGIRQFLSNNSTFVQLIDFGELPVFADASTFPLILITKSGWSADHEFIYAPIKHLDFSDLSNEVAKIQLVLDRRSIKGERWTLASKPMVSILDKINTIGTALKKYINTTIRFGLKTGLNKAFVIDRNVRDALISEDSQSIHLIHPYVLGDDVRKYTVNFNERYLILIPKGWTISQIGRDASEPEAWHWFSDRYSALANHLELFQERARKRLDQGDFWWELRACEYYSEFKKPKIIYPDIAKESRIAFDTAGLYLTNTVYFIPSDDKYLLGILNSGLIFNYYKHVASVLGDANKGGRLRWFRQDVLKLPIRAIDFDNPADVAMHDKMVALVETMLDLHKQLPGLSGIQREMAAAQIERADAEIDALVYRLYGLTDDEIAIVEG